MKIKIVSLVIVSAFLLGACAAPEWKEFTSDKGGFSVLMPGTPKEQTQSVDTAAGKIDVTMYTAQTGDVAYICGFSDYPQELVDKSDPKAILDGAANGAVSNVSGTNQTSQDISLDGNPGKEFAADAKVKDPGDASLKARVYLVKNRLYQVLVIALKSKASDADMSKYLQSFKLAK